MSTNITDSFNAILDKIIEDDQGKFDFRCKLSDIKLDLEANALDRKFIINGSSEYAGLIYTDFIATSNSYGQIMNRFNIPAAYAIKVPPTLLEPHFEYFKKKATEANPDKEIFVRAKNQSDGTVTLRAVLSDRYATLDNKHVVSEFKSALEGVAYTVKDYHITEDMFNARIVLDDCCVDGGIGPDGKPNKFYAGLHIINGETGNYPASLELIIYEQWCTNGCVRRFDSKAIFARRHIGEADLISEFRLAIAKAMINAQESIQMLLETKSQTFPDPLMKLNDVMDRDRRLFSEEVRPKVIEAWESRPEPTKYGIISAITQTAQIFDYERRLEFERFAGKLMGARI